MSEQRLRWRLVVEYHGRDFVGWQIQPNGRSVQAELERAAAALFGHPTHMAASGRTDAGVHALGQVVAFNAPVERSARGVRDGLNAHLPPDVAVVSAERAESDFDPRRQARRKVYRYTWLDRASRSPWLADRSVHLRRRLDAGRMHEAVACLVGTHDVASFRAVGCGARTTVRTIQGASVRREGDLVHLEVEGHGFLRHMVRIIAGTLVPIGLGDQPVEAFAQALRACDRRAAGPTAPPHGLCLVEVRYDGPPVDEEDEDVTADVPAPQHA